MTDFETYRVQFFMGILRIILIKDRNVSAPPNGPEWLTDIIMYLLSEFSNSYEEIFQLASEFAQSKSFEDLKSRLIQINLITPANFGKQMAMQILNKMSAS